MQRTVINGQVYITAQSRGTEYTLMRNGDGWFVASRRLSLGHAHIGGGTHYATLQEVADSCKAFGGVGALHAAVYLLDEPVTA